MGQDLEIAGRKESRLAWVEPEIKQLDVRETSSNPGRGQDLEFSQGHNAYPDCTRS